MQNSGGTLVALDSFLGYLLKAQLMFISEVLKYGI
jgi:hypothetical protein